MYHSFWIHSFADGHLGGFQYLAIVNCAAMNIGVHRFFWIGVSGFLRYNSTKKLLDLINEFGKTAGYKVNTQKSKAFLYTNKETAETEIRKQIPFDIATRKINKRYPNWKGKSKTVIV